MQIKDHQPLVLAGGIVLVVVLITLILKYPLAPTPAIAPVATLPDVALTTTTPVKIPAKTNTKTTGTLTYEQAVAKYEGFILQFNTQCQSTPSRKTVKNNTTLMLDNRTNTKKTIAIDGKSYSVPAYGYSLATFSNSKLPHVAIINCGSQNNVAQVTIQ